MRIESRVLRVLRPSAGLLVAGLFLGCPGSSDSGARKAAAPPPVQTQPDSTGATPVQRLQPGDPFPAGTFANLNPEGPARIDLADDLGRRPVVLYYWIAGNRRAEQVFRDLEQLGSELGSESLAIYAVSVPRANLATAPQIRARVQTLGFRSPVIEDTGFTIGKRLGVERVPHLSILDAEGRLRVTNGATLVQKLTAEQNLEQAIREVATTGSLATHEPLGRYFPVKELEGRPSPDFTARLLESRVERKWSSLLDDEKLNVLVFWSVDCPHCRQELPEMQELMREHGSDVNLVTCARATSEDSWVKTEQFCDSHGLTFPTLVDEDTTIADLYGITTTPTVLIIGPDGVVDTAIVSHSHGEDGTLAETIERKKRELLPGGPV